MAMEGLIATAEASDFGRRSAQRNLYPLWEMETLHQTGEPRPEPVAHWRWSEIQPLIGEAVAATSTSRSERRVLLLGNPAFPDVAVRPHTTAAMHAALQILMPGESARAHRHTPNALRYMMEDGGETFTLVDGKACRMNRGDVIFTPANCWHSHYHEGTTRSVWFDALDAQVVQYFDAGFFELHRDDGSNMPRTIPDEAFAEVGFAPVLPDEIPGHYSPRFRFPWEATVRALDAAPERDDGSSWVRLVNPAGGAMAMAPIDCRMARLSRTPTRPERTTAGTICVVARGEGGSTIGDEEIAWRENDVFTVPHWAWASHRATAPDTTLLVVSDRDVLARLALLREERR